MRGYAKNNDQHLQIYFITEEANMLRNVTDD